LRLRARERDFAPAGATKGALPLWTPRSLERLANFLGGFADKIFRKKVNTVVLL